MVLFNNADRLDIKLRLLDKKLEAELQAFFCVSAASYNLLIGEAYYFLAAAGKHNQSELQAI